MIKTLTILSGLFLLSVMQNAFSADEKGRYWIYGEGKQTCSAYTDARNSGGFAEVSYKNWISGYLTSSNRSTDDTYNLLGNTDFQGALAWIDRYCRKNPQNTLYMAMANMTAVYYPRRRKSK